MTYEEAIRDIDKIIKTKFSSSNVPVSLKMAVEALENKSEDVWIVLEHNRFYGVDEFNEPIYRRGGRTYVHRKCGYNSAVGSNFCPRCGVRMRKE